MKLLLLGALAALTLPSFATAQQAPAAPPATNDPVLTVDFSNPALSPSHWTLTLHPDGSGHFRSTMGNVTRSVRGQMQIPNLDRDIHLSPPFAEKAFETAKRHNWFNEECESKIKVAFQGSKTLSYAGPDGKGSCTFNYSRDKEIQNLGDSFVAVSATILEGARLEMLLQHDPLGLEQEIESLVAASQDGRVQQLYAIRDILQRLAGDDNVMEMVRKRARLLLSRAET